MFSFNNPFGACKKCDGLGTFKEIDPELIIPDRKMSINQGAIKASGWNVAEGSSIARMYLDALAKEYNFSLDMPVEMINDESKRQLKNLYRIFNQKRNVYLHGSNTSTVIIKNYIDAKSIFDEILDSLDNAYSIINK